ncbi:MAG: hypothetical protein IH859_03920 [Chloroflexi bacterium]|nr:hypothetical protein [Chloroflexota bacterium]
MRSRNLLRFVTILIITLFIGNSAFAQDFPPGDAIRGAQLYDNWFVMLDQLPPAGDQPLWGTQDSNERSGTVTWRCSTCHGWDYKGVDGALGPGSQEYTGFPGVFDVVGSSGNEILAALDGTQNPAHNFFEHINRRALLDIIAFLRTKLVDVDLIIDNQDQSSFGIAAYGRGLFGLSCTQCHGEDGSALNFASAVSPAFIADVALEDPWRFIHIVRFGSPLLIDHAFESSDWSLQNVADTLAYAQSLPPGDPLAGQARPGTADTVQDIAGQGQLSAIIFAAALIVLVILLGLAWTSYNPKS